MNNIILSHDSALAYWSGPLSQFPFDPLDAPESNEALLLANKSVHAAALKTLRSLPLSAYLPHRLDVLVPRKSDHRTTKQAWYHCMQARMPDAALVEIHARRFYVSGEMHRLLVSSPELCFVQMANLLNDWELIELGYELCGDYAINPAAARGFTQRPAVTTPAALEAFMQQADGVPGIQRARRVTKWILDGSRDPQESRAAILAHLSRTKGGLGMDAPLLNHSLELPEEAQQLLGIEMCKPVLYWPDMRAVIDLESAERLHVSETVEDGARRRNAYFLLGLNAMTLTDEQLKDLSAFEAVCSALNERSAKPVRRRPANSKQLQTRHDLHEFLFHGERRERFAAPEVALSGVLTAS